MWTLCVNVVNVQCLIKQDCLQVDPRLPVSAQENVKQRMAKMFHRCDVDPARASAALAAAYHDVTRERILCEQ